MKEDKEKKPKSQTGRFIRIPIQTVGSGLIEFMFTSHYRVLSVIDLHKNKKSWDKEKGAWQSFPSLRTIRDETKLNRATVQRAIKDLVGWGFIEKTLAPRKGGGGYKVVYWIFKEPGLRSPLKRIRKKVLRKKRERGKNGKFTGSHKP